MHEHERFWRRSCGELDVAVYSYPDITLVMAVPSACLLFSECGVAEKIFISYRREDTAANALGISQYLEKEFGRQNVFIDVDMRAGENFPLILEQRLAQCKVMLVLIGPDWLTVRDEHGNRRLDSPDDWVRLEVAYALKRDITVIPVRVGGAELPPKTELPEDLQNLVDHQAVSITVPGFRYEMSGLARDIRAIPGRKSWWRAKGGRRRASIVLSGAALAFVLISIALGHFSRLRDTVSLPWLPNRADNNIWGSLSGEWVLYAVDKQPVAYYFNKNSIKVFDDRIVYTGRYPFKSNQSKSEVNRTQFQSAYEDDELVINCTKSTFLSTEKFIYNRDNKVISHYIRGDPKTIDMSKADQIPPGSILDASKRLFCDETLRSPIADDPAAATNYLSPVLNGEAEAYYAETHKEAEGVYKLLLVTRYYRNQLFNSLFPGQDVVGLPQVYRTIVNPVKIDCAVNKIETPKSEYFDYSNNLEYLSIPMPVPIIIVNEGSPLSVLFYKLCGKTIVNVSGKYEGKNYAADKSGGQTEEKIFIDIEQIDQQIAVRFKAANGAQGEGKGVLEGNKVKIILLNSTTPNCPGSYQASMEFNKNNSLNWAFKGQDCSGVIEGHGTAEKTKA
jgi:hypothetical protein